MIEDNASFEQIEELFQRYADRYEHVSAECMSKVSEWRWASGQMYDPRPFRLLIDKRGRWAKSFSRVNSHQYGLDSSGNPVVRRYFNNGETYDNETYYYISDEEALSLTYRLQAPYDGLISATITEYREKLPTRHMMLTKGIIKTTRYSELYTQSDGRIRHAKCTRDEGGRIDVEDLDYEYDDRGEITSIRWSRASGESGLSYIRKSTLNVERDNLLSTLRASLKASAMGIIDQFWREHPEEILYAFAFVTVPEGNSLYCAFATEQGLDRVALEYLAKGYRVSKGEPVSTFRNWLRWLSPEDGWYAYEFGADDAFRKQLDVAFATGIFKLYDSQPTKLFIEVLRDLDQAGYFGDGVKRESVTIGVSIPDNPEDFIKSAKLVNSKSAIDRTRKEFRQGLSLEQQVHRV